MFNSKVLIVVATFAAPQLASAQSVNVDIDLRTGQPCVSESVCAGAPVIGVSVETEMNADSLNLLFTATSRNLVNYTPYLEAQTGLDIVRNPNFRSSGSTFTTDLRIDPHNIINPRDFTVTLKTVRQVGEPAMSYRNFPEQVDMECPRGSYPNSYSPKVSVTTEGFNLSVNIDDVPGWLERDIRKDLASGTTDKLFYLFSNLEALGADVNGLSLQAIDDNEVQIQFQIGVTNNGIPNFLDNLGRALGRDQGFTIISLIQESTSGEINQNSVVQKFLLQATQESPHWPIVKGTPNFFCQGANGVRYLEP